MTDHPDAVLSRALGARILSEANDLKRTPDALADEIGLDRALIADVVAGRAEVGLCRDVLQRMVDAYPIGLRDVWVEPDDTDDGCKIMRAEASAASARVFDRKDRDGALTPYYEYRDTAMSRLGPFKPEWIQPLRVVADADPDNPDVAYNNGHLLHQMTFFIGGVNFYWECGGVRRCAELTTGDSNYITPFAPHSFTSRDPDRPGLIIAVTFAGAVRRAIEEFALVGGEGSDRLAGDLRSAENAFAARLRRQLSNEWMTPAALARGLAADGIDSGRSELLADGAAVPNSEELGLIAARLNVRPQDLTACSVSPEEDVVVTAGHEAEWRPWPDGNAPSVRLKPLARCRHQPGLKGFHVEAVSDRDGGPEANATHGLFEYVYNYGDRPVRILWSEGRSEVLEPGDSACLRPMTPHRFCLPQGDREPARFFLVRVPGSLDDSALGEYARFASEGRRRVSQETKRWF